jgi:hypothetical protein
MTFIKLAVLDGVMVSVFATGPTVRGSKPAEDDQNLQHTFLRRGSKAVGIM